MQYQGPGFTSLSPAYVPLVGKFAYHAGRDLPPRAQAPGGAELTVSNRKCGEERTGCALLLWRALMLVEIIEWNLGEGPSLLALVLSCYLS